MELDQEDKYDVFLSFRGPDTRSNFTDHLFSGLAGVGIRVFRDDDELRHGKEIGHEILKALDESRIYIPIFSKGYADSPWCLRELAHMVDCRSTSDGKKEILPVFYNVGPADVKLKTQLYKKAISRHKKKFGSDQLKRWESALVEVVHTKGWEVKDRREAELVKSIVEEVCIKVGDKRVDVPKNLVEDHHQINAIIEKLDVGSSGVRFIGIHGMGGIGKTTLAKVVFNKLYSHFDSVCFLNDIRHSSQEDLINLQKKLVSSIGGSRVAHRIVNIEAGVQSIRRVCNSQKVLIVLDNLDKKEQLEKLAGEPNWFGSGSRIIITTRDKGILINLMKSSRKEVVNQPEGTLDYGVHAMEFDRALLLFYKHAFGSDFPEEDYVCLSREVVKKVDRLPLAVEVMGSFLYCHGSMDPHFDKKKLWEETLRKLDTGPFKDVRQVLMISYEGLENEQKEVFLDIACFFINEDKRYPNIMWDDCNYYARIAISILLQRSLIKLGADDKFWMHDQVRDLGRYIVLKEYPCRYSRVWIHEDAVKLLEKKERNEDVKALSLTSDGHNCSIAPEEFAALPNLRFLRVKRIGIFGNFNSLLLKQRWLFPQRWQTIFSATANVFHFGNLVMLDLSDSDIEDGWGGWSQMKMIQLKVLNLSGCLHLKRTPDFSNFLSLEMLILAGCVKLTEIHRSIGKLKRLQTLDIKGCDLLRELPAEIGALRSLTEIIMPRNSKHFKLPDTFGDLNSLSSLMLDGNPGINQLPKSIGALVKLTHLSLRGCVGIKELPSSIGEMELLAKLDLSYSGIVELPDSIGDLKKLKVFDVSYTKIKEFPHTIGHVKMLEELRAEDCRHLTDKNLEEIGNLSNLRILNFSYTHVSSFPSALRLLSHLQTLEWGSSHLQEALDLLSSLTRLHLQAHHFPSSLNLSSLVSLEYLELHRLTASIAEPGPSGTKNLPEERLIHPLPSGLSTLRLRDISQLPPFSNLRKLADLSVIEYQLPEFYVSPDLIHLTKLKLSECKSLVYIIGLPLLENLRCLDLNGLESLVEIHGLSELKSLMYFRISHCHRIERLHSLSKLDKLEQIETQDCPQIRDIEGLRGLESLELDNHGLNVLQRLLNGKRWTRLSRTAH